MRFIVIVVFGMFALYGGYWFVGSAAKERALIAAIEEMRSNGLSIEVADVHTRGFPSRFDTTITAIDLGDPATGRGWQAPFIQILALSYVPNRVIVVWPETQTVRLPGQNLTVTGAGLRASGAVRPDLSLPLRNATFEGGQTALASDKGWQMSWDHSLAAIRDAAGDDLAPNSYDVFGEVTNLRPSAVPGLPVLDQLRLDGLAVFDSPLDRFALTGTPARPTELTLRDMTLRWGPALISGHGEVRVDELGQLDGVINLTVSRWQETLTMFEDGRLIGPVLARAIRRMGVARGVAEDLDVRVVISAGQASVGAIPLMAIPALW
ncbi:MAG: DUF2125 domain-containing protein [Flavimaricola sp.]|nr:DUF2125 domain-containing protein [Flavimaricola sp.]